MAEHMYTLYVLVLAALQIFAQNDPVIFAGGANNVPRTTSSIPVPHQRFILGTLLGSNRPGPKCTLPGGKEGLCLQAHQCPSDQIRLSLPQFVLYMCVIDHIKIGVCCPKRALGSLPSIGQQAVVSSPTSTPLPSHPLANIDDTAPPAPPIAGPSFNDRGCGVSSVNGGRIVGGRPAQPRAWPWMAALINQKGTQFCGGSLITDRHVLTAAHCVHSMTLSTLSVRLGEYDLDVNNETRHQNFKIASVEEHFDYDRAAYRNDIAIVKLSRPVVFDTYIWPVCLPPQGMDFENKTAVVTGWGTLYFGGPASSVLMEVAIPVWNQRYCMGKFTQPIQQTMLCAGAYEGGKDSCQGDSGGPLVYQMDTGRWVQIGIVSWGIECGVPDHPGIYTRVTSFLDWIMQHSVF